MGQQGGGRREKRKRAPRRGGERAVATLAAAAGQLGQTGCATCRQQTDLQIHSTRQIEKLYTSCPRGRLSDSLLSNFANRGPIERCGDLTRCS